MPGWSWSLLRAIPSAPSPICPFVGRPSPTPTRPRGRLARAHRRRANLSLIHISEPTRLALI
eukprot:9296780-Alexandrium_andersonii.AAC.1